MKAYVATTGLLFSLLVVVHAARIVAEGRGPLGQPFFVVSTMASLAMAAWALFLLLKHR